MRDVHALKNVSVTYVLNHKSYLIHVNNISIEIGEKCGIFYLVSKKKDFTCSLDVSVCSEIPKKGFLMTWLIIKEIFKLSVMKNNFVNIFKYIYIF